MGEGRLIVAVDSYREGLEGLVESLAPMVSGFKVGLPLLISRGAGVLASIRSRAGGAMVIADLKLADIGEVMVETVKAVERYVDAVIAHSFVGYSGALERLKEYLDSRGVRLVVVASMSHAGSGDVYDKAFDHVMEVVRKTDPWGLVAPATRPCVISAIRARLGQRYRILAPGVGAQGARPGDALCAGADYEIVGRAVMASRDPVKAAADIIEAQKRAGESCGAPRTC